METAPYAPPLAVKPRRREAPTLATRHVPVFEPREARADTAGMFSLVSPFEPRIWDEVARTYDRGSSRADTRDALITDELMIPSAFGSICEY